MIARVGYVAIALCLLAGAGSAQQTWHVVDRVMDGDTVTIGLVGTVRLIGVDSPEMAPRPQSFARESSEFLKKLLGGQMVRLEHDGPHQDRYGRTLAYLYLADGTFVNEEIVKRGYGRAYLGYRFTHRNRFEVLEREARLNGLGLWSSAVYLAPNAAPASRPLSVAPSAPARAVAAPDGQCHGITQKGVRCKRRVRAGVSFCYQHGG